MERQLWKLRSRSGVTAVCTLHFPGDRQFPTKWTVVVTWNGKPVRRNAFNRMSNAVLSADRARQRLRSKDWATVEGE